MEPKYDVRAILFVDYLLKHTRQEEVQEIIDSKESIEYKALQLAELFRSKESPCGVPGSLSDFGEHAGEYSDVMTDDPEEPGYVEQPVSKEQMPGLPPTNYAMPPEQAVKDKVAEDKASEDKVDSGPSAEEDRPQYAILDVPVPPQKGVSLRKRLAGAAPFCVGIAALVAGLGMTRLDCGSGRGAVYNDGDSESSALMPVEDYENKVIYDRGCIPSHHTIFSYRCIGRSYESVSYHVSGLREYADYIWEFNVTYNPNFDSESEKCWDDVIIPTSIINNLDGMTEYRCKIGEYDINKCDVQSRGEKSRKKSRKKGRRRARK
jgi:hypothetical protein